MTSRDLRRTTPALALLLPLLALPRGLAGQTAHLVRDIDDDPSLSATPAGPTSLFVLGGKVLFIAASATSQQLWISDGTRTGTEPITDGCPVDCSAELAATLPGGVAAFWLSSSLEPPGELWRSDGTRRGTYALTGGPLTVRNEPHFAVAGGRLYFEACAGSTCGLARTDGTAGGTLFLHDFNSVYGIAALGDKAYVATDLALWESDGTVAGTREVASLPNGPLRLTATAHRLFFLAPYTEPQLWTSDGTAAGTRQLTNLPVPDAFHQTTGFKVAGDRVYFVADDVTHGAEIWTSDGTVAGTRAVTDFGFFDPFGFANSFEGLAVSQMEVLGNRLLFTATDGVSPVKLWRSDGSPATTAPVSDLTVSLTDPLLRIGGRVLFRSGAGLWATDGTAGGTVRIHDVFHSPLPLPGGAVFDAAAGRGVTLWWTDGTLAGTRRLDAEPLGLPSPLLPFDPTLFAAAGGKLFTAARIGGPQSADDSQTGLWVVDGGPGGGRFVATVETGTAGSDLRGLAALGDAVFFRAVTAGGDASNVWQSAGSEETTGPVTGPTAGDPFDAPVAAGSRIFFWHRGDGLRPQLWSAGAAVPAAALTHLTSDRYPDSSPPLTPFGGRVAVALRPDAGDVEIWASDGTSGGTGRVVALPGVIAASALSAVGTQLYFLAESASASHQLWTSDGTAAGTRQVSAVEGFADTPRFAAAGPFVVFRTGEELWTSDGTPEGARRLVTGVIAGPQELGGAVYFLTASSTDSELWRTDGSPAGTYRLASFQSGAALLESFELAAAGGRLFFSADDGVHGLELWTSDGTASGTALVRDIAAGLASSGISSLTPAGGRVYFAADDGVHGVELWQSDGTADGTRLAADVAPETLSSYPRELTAAAGQLYFTADDALHGRELWALPLAGPAGCQPSSDHLCLQEGRFEVEAEWRDFQGNAGHGTAVALTSDTGYFWFFNPANVEVVTKVLDGRGVNQAFWVFYGALSSVEYALTVTDTETGLTRRYFNPAGELASVGDTHGFGPLGAFDSNRDVQKESDRPRAARSLTLVSASTDPRAATGSCAAGPGRLCLNGGRFAVTATWKDFQGHTGQGTAVAMTGDTGYFWFFDPANVEVVAKVIDGRAVNDKFWLFYGALSSVEYTLTVTDTQTGAVRMYKNASGNLASAADTGAF